jgi:hypothetical protein
MLTKQSISLLVVSALLILPSGIAKVGNINLQNGNTQATVVQERNISIKNSNSQVKINRDRSSPIYHHRHRQIYNSRLQNRPATVKPQRRIQNNCQAGTYSHQSSQTTVSGDGVSLTHSSASTMCK